MKNKDIAILKIIQYINSNEKASKGEIYSYFNIKPDGKGGYENKGKWPFEQRSLSRYIDELEKLEIIKKGKENFYSINDEKFINSSNKENKSLEKLLNILLQSRELELFNQIGTIANKKINEEYVNKIINAIDIPFEEIKIDKNIEEKIKSAICNSEKIRIEYKNNKKYNISPIAIVKNMNKNKKYLFYLEKEKFIHLFDLSNIKSVEILNKKDFNKEKYIEEIERRWDIDGGSLQEVEVLFFDKYEVISRVKEELSNRKGHELIKTEEGYIFKDTIDGINDFKKWIKTFGKECIVLKPEKLREDILKNYKIKEERYKKVINNEI